MKQQNILRIVLLAGIVVVIGLIAVMSTMAYRNQNSTRLFKDGENAFLNGDYDTAATILANYLAKDPDKEEAWNYLAEISEKRGDLFQAANYWGRLMHLNPLKSEYLTKCIMANYRIHNYVELDNLFGRLNEDKRNEFQDIYTLTKFKNEPEKDETLQLIEKLPKDGAMARLIRALQNSGPVSELAALEESDDIVIQVEALILDAAIAERIEKNLERAEACYRKAAELNPPLCKGELGSFLYRQNRHQEAVEAFKEMKGYAVAATSIMDYAEALFCVKDLEGLKKIDEMIPRGMGKVISIRAYLHCLQAFMEKDAKEMVNNYNVAQIRRSTPAWYLISYAVAVESKDLPLLTKVLSAWKNTTIFPQKLQEILVDIGPLLDNALKNKDWKNAESLAVLFLDEKPPVLNAWKAYLLAKAANKNYPEDVIAHAIALFPKEPLFRRLALQARIAVSDFPGSIEAFEKLIENSANKQAEIYRKALFLEQVGRLDDAFKEIKRILEMDGSLVNLKHCLAFGMRTGNKEALATAAKEPSLQAIATFETERRFGDIAKAEKMLREQPLEQGLSAERIEDRELLLPLSLFLGVLKEHQRAIAAYKALSPYMTKDPTLDVNLSEIYADLGEKKQALEYAEKAYKSFPGSPLAQAIYGLRCAENEDYEQATRLIPESATGHFRDILVLSLENTLEDAFQNQRYPTCESIVTRISKLQPDNSVAKEYREKLEQLKAQKQEEQEEQDE